MTATFGEILAARIAHGDQRFGDRHLHRPNIPEAVEEAADGCNYLGRMEIQRLEALCPEVADLFRGELQGLAHLFHTLGVHVHGLAERVDRELAQRGFQPPAPSATLQRRQSTAPTATVV
jgi:hypothetical protein